MSGWPLHATCTYNKLSYLENAYFQLKLTSDTQIMNEVSNEVFYTRFVKHLLL